MTMLLEPRFCYRILGKEKDNYTETVLEGGNLLPKQMYASVHRNLKHTLAKELGVPPQFIICISQELYDQQTKKIS